MWKEGLKLGQKNRLGRATDKNSNKYLNFYIERGDKSSLVVVHSMVTLPAGDNLIKALPFQVAGA